MNFILNTPKEMILSERKKCEARILALLDQNPQVSELYLRLVTLFDSLPFLVSFLLFYLVNRLLKTSHQLAFLFCLCQVCEDPLFADAVGLYWPHRPSPPELRLMYELIVEKNFRDFISLPISKLESRVEALHLAHKLELDKVLTSLIKLLQAPSELPRCEPIRIENEHAFAPPSNFSLFDEIGDNEELLVRQASLLRYSPGLSPQLLLPLPRSLESELATTLQLADLAPVSNPCLDTQLLISSQLGSPGTISVADRRGIMHFISKFPSLVDQKLFAGRTGWFINENPDLTVELLQVLEHARPDLYELFLKEILAKSVDSLNSLVVVTKLAASDNELIQGFLDQFLENWFDSCARDEGKTQMRRLYLVVRIVEELIAKKQFDPTLRFEKWIAYCNSFSKLSYMEIFRDSLLTLARRTK